MKNIALLPNPKKDPGYSQSMKILSFLLEKGFNVFSLKENKIFSDKNVTLLDKLELSKQVDCIITLGGDGTILHTANFAALSDIPILGINLGNIGYMSELESHELKELEKLISNEYNIENRMMLNVKVLRNGKEVLSSTALNDAVVGKGASSKIVFLDVYSKDKKISSYKADGLIVSTPTGSTAYSMSAGGPILEPDFEAFILTPICPHALFARPIVFSPNSIIEIKVGSLEERDANLAIDGVLITQLEEGDIITIEKSSLYIKLIKIKNLSFYEILNSKLSEGSEST